MPWSRGRRLALWGCGGSACWLPWGLSPAQPFPRLPQFRSSLWCRCAPAGVTSQTAPKDTRDFAQQPVAPQRPTSAAGVRAVLGVHLHTRAMAVLRGARSTACCPQGHGACSGMWGMPWGAGRGLGSRQQCQGSHHSPCSRLRPKGSVEAAPHPPGRVPPARSVNCRTWSKAAGARSLPRRFPGLSHQQRAAV